MPVGELFLSAFLQVLFDRLTSPELLGFLREEGLYSKIKKWEVTLKMIQAVLGDAEDKQLKSRAVKMWLDDLRDLAYDAEDMLDEFATEAFARKLKMEQHQQASTSKVRNLLPACFNNWSPRAIKFNIRMRSEIKNVTSRLEELCKLRDGLGLKEITGGTSSNTVPQRLPTTSVPTEPAVHGRDVDKEKILEMVLKNEPSDANFRVIPVVGMGGVRVCNNISLHKEANIDDLRNASASAIQHSSAYSGLAICKPRDNRLDANSDYQSHWKSLL